MGANRDRRLAVTRLVPHAKASDKCVGVVARSAAWREFLQLVYVPAAQDHIVRLKCRNELSDNVAHGFTPLLLAAPLQSADPDVVLVSALPVRQVGEVQPLTPQRA